METKPQKKILVLSNDTTILYALRGEVLRAMAAQGYAVTLVCKEEKHVEALRQMGCDIVPIQMETHGKNPLQDLLLLRKFYCILKKSMADIVCTYNIKPNVYGGIACAWLGIPYLVNVCGLGTPVEYPGPLQKLTCLLYKIGVRKAACVFFQSEDNRSFFVQRRMLAGRYRMLPGSGVNLQKYSVLPYPQGGTVDFLFVARIMKEKGIDQYLQAAQVITQKYPNTRFHVIGGCDDETYLAKLKELDAAGIIRYHGWQADMAPFQRMSACTVHPTYYPEGVSNVLLEASASGRPIITTDRSGCKEVVEDGVTGFICKQRDAGDLIKQIEKFLALPWEQRRNMGLAGRAKVEREFDRQIVVDRYLEELKGVSGNDGKAT